MPAVFADAGYWIALWDVAPGITEALAYDRDFEQAGFAALLRVEQDS